MAFCWFAAFDRLPERPATLDDYLAMTPGVTKVLAHAPAATRDPYLDDGASPPLALQMYFPDITALEAAVSASGHLAALPDMLPGATAVQQAMLVRPYPVPDLAFQTPAGEPHCTYLVAYEGVAEDMNAWLGHYVTFHPGIMARFPGIRQIEIYSRIDWVGGIPWPRSEAMQRNKVVFDSPEALTAALNSPVRHEMRDDFHRFPPYSGRNTHYAMATTVLAG